MTTFIYLFIYLFIIYLFIYLFLECSIVNAGNYYIEFSLYSQYKCNWLLCSTQ